MLGDIRLWIIVPLVLMIPLNVAFWFVYVNHQETTSAKIGAQTTTLWEYFQSDTFKGITVSLIIPIFMFLFERRFKILENYEATRAERLSQIIKDNREKRWETIKNTEIMWNNLYELATEVCYFEKSDNGKIKIKELLKKIVNYPTEAEGVINDWNNRLPNVEAEDENIKKYYTAYANAKEFLKDRSLSEYFASEEWKSFTDAYYSVSQKLHAESSRYFYTRQGIKNFANWCGLNNKAAKAAMDAVIGNKGK